jgi:hypothetical protein
MRVELVIASAACAALLVVPLVRFARRREYACAALAAWLLAISLVFLVDAILWSDNVANSAPLWCDLSRRCSRAASASALTVRSDEADHGPRARAPRVRALRVPRHRPRARRTERARAPAHGPREGRRAGAAVRRRAARVHAALWVAPVPAARRRLTAPQRSCPRTRGS